MSTSPLRLPERPGARRLSLAVAATWPTLLTWLYFVRLADAPGATQQIVYALGKTAQFALPVVFVLLILRRPVAWNSVNRRGLTEGLISGWVSCGGILALLWLLARSRPELITGLSSQIALKIADLGIDTPGRYLAVAIFYSLVHSALEEYYWRWFVYGQLRRFLRARPAIWLAALAFAAHHVILVGFYSGWDGPITLSMSLAIGVGGAYWAWLYERTGSLVGPWISHLLVDAVIFAAGWYLL